MKNTNIRTGNSEQVFCALRDNGETSLKPQEVFRLRIRCSHNIRRPSSSSTSTPIHEPPPLVSFETRATVDVSCFYTGVLNSMYTMQYRDMSHVDALKKPRGTYGSSFTEADAGPRARGKFIERSSKNAQDACRYLIWSLMRKQAGCTLIETSSNEICKIQYRTFVCWPATNVPEHKELVRRRADIESRDIDAGVF